MTTTAALPTPVSTSPAVHTAAVRLEGGLFGPDLLEQLEGQSLPGLSPADFGIATTRSLLDEVAQAYRDARDLWRNFQQRLQRLSADNAATTLTRENWVLPLLNLLGYQLHRQSSPYQLGEVAYPISYRAGDADDSPPVHVVGAGQPLGQVDPSLRPRLSPHALLQEFLNRSEHLWGIVTNGLVLRLLRKTSLLRRQAYVEFDLATLFADEETDRFHEFFLFFSLVHRSRLPAGLADAHHCWLERYHQQAVEQGNRARDRLRDGVERCLELLGTGFLRANPSWSPDPQNLYQDLLRLVYRFLFLLVTEERELIDATSLYHAPADTYQLYRAHYSISRLRRLADQHHAYTEHDDLWHSLRLLWLLLRDHTPQVDGKPLASLLGLPVLDGALFQPLSLDQLSISNRDLLQAFHYLAFYYDEESHTPHRVNYAALDVEELGSVYESLLEHHPQILSDPAGGRTFGFGQGNERRSTGSYYTPPELVQELVKSAVEPVLHQRLQAARPEHKEQAILSMKIIDPAAGSGHFLLAAARRLGKELARLRSGEEEPNPEQLREATRDVIAHCLYGVDKNPLAVELCRVALWIESHTPTRPLTFLDHHIRCGDALVGLTDLDQLHAGIPDQAFEPVADDNKSTARALRQQNADQRAGQYTLFDTLEPTVLRNADSMRQLDAIPDTTVENVIAKARRWQEIRQTQSPLLLAADAWTAAFFQELKPDRPALTTVAVRMALAGQPLQTPLGELLEALTRRLRFFHWHLEFPEVFAEGGFDVVLCNPPWERIKLQEQEFFATRDPEIARAPNKAARQRLIGELPQRNPALWQEYQQALHDADATSKFLRASGRFPLTARGDINTYSVFTELLSQLLRPNGRAGIVVPT
ncbi:MAG: N-6 DNA methylase, partial [Thermogemmata sp.]|nr:N-6 DNA methylase [Thermogemmata sp.]